MCIHINWLKFHACTCNTHSSLYMYPILVHICAFLSVSLSVSLLVYETFAKLLLSI